MRRMLKGAARIAAVVLIFSGSARALQIRGYTAARHDRFTGYPAAPAWNPSAWFNSISYMGVGWIPPGSETKQFVLVSPKHILCATHYVPTLGTTIRFLNSSGVAVDRTVAAIQTVADENGDLTDLTVCTLDSIITPAEGVTPLPYLQLMSGEGYTDKFLTFFGWHAKAGSTSITNLYTYTNPGNNAETRILETKYRIASGNQDDCYVEAGDSGSPSFAMVNGQPALVGLHFLEGSSATHRFSYDTLVPFYITQLNLLMAGDGYAMTPLATTSRLTLSAGTSPAVMRQANAGLCQFTVSNPAAGAAANVKLTLEFPAGSAPSSISASGWTVTNLSPKWELTRPSLPAGAGSSVTASWTSLPVADTLPIRVSYSADGTALSLSNLDLTIRPSFAAWATGLPDTTQAGDPDNDGVSNLVEYAFGSDAASGAAVSSSGILLLPEMIVSEGTATLSFPVRSDATDRGITYSIEYSQTLEGASWTTTPPSGATSLVMAYSPAWTGFSNRRISFPAVGGKQFARVRVLLSE